MCFINVHKDRHRAVIVGLLRLESSNNVKIPWPVAMVILPLALPAVYLATPLLGGGGMVGTSLLTLQDGERCSLTHWLVPRSTFRTLPDSLSVAVWSFGPLFLIYWFRFLIVFFSPFPMCLGGGWGEGPICTELSYHLFIF